METVVLNLKIRESYQDYIKTAAEALRRGELVAFPTETVYGLGVHRDNADAVKRLFEAKKRPEEKRLTLMIADPHDVTKYVNRFSDTEKRLMDFFWPGALAIVFTAKNSDGICIRLPDNAIARDLIRMAQVPVVTTSANISGQPPATDAQQVLMDMKGRIHVILDGGSTRLRSPSTIIRVNNGAVEVLRHGVITETSIKNCLQTGLMRL